MTCICLQGVFDEFWSKLSYLFGKRRAHLLKGKLHTPLINTCHHHTAAALDPFIPQNDKEIFKSKVAELNSSS